MKPFCNDESFGPVVNGCHRDFDFTILFEDIIFSILPSLIAILAASMKILRLRHQQRLVTAGRLQAVKLLALAVYAALQTAAYTPETEAIGKGLIGAYALVYIGMAVTTGAYWYRHYRVLTMIRGCLVSAIGWQTLRINAHAMSDPKAPVTLMSTDVERILFGLRSFHEFWAIVIQVGILTYLLHEELGTSLVVPVFITALSSIATVWVSRSSHARQVKWMQAAQSRIGATSKILSSIKTIKMRALTESVSSVVHDLRLEELMYAARFRILLVWTAGLGYMPQFISPLLTFLVFILSSRATHQVFDAPRAFTSLSLLLLIAQSLSQTLLDLPSLLAAFGSSARIDDFLLAEHQTDFRDFDIHYSLKGLSAEIKGCSKAHGTVDEKAPVELATHPIAAGPETVIQISQGCYGWGDGDVLHDINLNIRRGQLTLVVGPVACGKSTLCHALLGETPTWKGRLHVSSDSKKMGFCSQTPYLTNGTIKENIVGYSDFSRPWYDAVVSACALSYDVAQMPSGDNTVIGSDGINLSGGQRQKIALARALYAQSSILVLDDVLSGLDSEGANHIFWHAMGPEGLARQQNITIIFATHATQFLPFSDYIVALSSTGKVAQQGNYPSLCSEHGFSPYLTVTQEQSVNKKGAPENEEAAASSENVSRPGTDKSTPGQTSADFAVYNYYAKAVGTWATLLLLFLIVLYAAAYNIPSYWLNVWDH
ncbi:ABC transporter [Hirsutella rhossiliensis]